MRERGKGLQVPDVRAWAFLRNAANCMDVLASIGVEGLARVRVGAEGYWLLIDSF